MTGVGFVPLRLISIVASAGVLALIYLRVRGHEEWMTKAQLVFEQSGSGH